MISDSFMRMTSAIFSIGSVLVAIVVGEFRHPKDHTMPVPSLAPSWLEALPRVAIGHLPTRLEPLRRLSKELGGPRIWVKRDDCTGLATGGNKTRKLEYLLAQAQAESATDVITFGAVQSNHARQTAAACARLGLPCHLVLTEQVAWKHRAYTTSGNVLLDHLFGAHVHIMPTAAAADFTQELRTSLEAQGRRPYLIPAGGSNTTGALGYVRCAAELIADCKTLGISPTHIVHASSSAGTQAGLVYGFARLAVDMTVHGINVYHEKLTDLESRILKIVGDLASRHGPIQTPPLQLTDRYRGQGYGFPTDATIDTIRLMARLEGLIFDPVYSGKAATALIDMVSVGQFGNAEDVILIHTGGFASLSVYDNAFTR